MKPTSFSIICCFVLASCATPNPNYLINRHVDNLSPDLEVIAIEIGDLSNNHQSLEVHVINNGSTSTAPCLMLAEFFYGSDVFQLSQEIPSFKPNSTQTITILAQGGQRFHYFTSSSVKEVLLQVNIDVLDHEQESNEWNNHFVEMLGYDRF